MNIRTDHAKHILAHFPEGVFTLDQNLVITYANDAFGELLGYEVEELVGTSIKTHVVDLAILQACRVDVERQGFCSEQKTELFHRDGQRIHIAKNVQMAKDYQGQPVLIVSIRDLTRVHQLNQTLQAYNETLSQKVAEHTHRLRRQMAYLQAYKTAVDTSAMTLMMDKNLTITDANGMMLQRSGHDLRALLSQSFFSLWHDDSLPLRTHLKKTLDSKVAWKDVVRYRSLAGQSFYLDTTLAPIYDEHKQVCEYVCIGYDVTALIESTHAMSYRLHNDPLTGLPNRQSLLEAIRADNPKQFGLVLFNVDRFSELNACFGHEAGDEVLKSLASTLREGLLGAAGGQLYKLPVDEFALLVNLKQTSPGFEVLVQEFLQHLPHQRFQIDGQQVNISVTAGWASTNSAGPQGRQVLSGADMALKRAKAQRQTFLAFDPTLKIQKIYQQNLGWIGRLNRGLEEGRFVPFYQPIVDAKTQQVVKYECLLRLREGNEYVLPGAFLDIAKRLRLYHRLTQTMIDQVFAKMATTHQHFSVNLSIEDIADEAMRNWLIRRIERCPDPRRLVLEIVESEGIQNYDTVREFIRAVKDQGVQVALDDFGAGYSNFAYMVQLDVDYLKIDGSIIRGICDNPASEVVTETILAFARKLQVKTIAEFVSDDAIAQRLKDFPFDELQGFHYGEPTSEVI
ncbi:MAG: EAL domain-containing protein [Hydrogenovibrio sp.]|uniref:sensor domain-containing protein n=1 Tax=Hydrogenovibrio sp. TaxID=2065821 RepID=UPI0028702B35|nr:EAL domain-containing protein [Hydrogenovibrio sp.]MDR9500094.1 EAL domain-containing protein [Hydrogenovibrio sp.]